MRRRHLVLLGLALLATTGRASERPEGPAIEITRVGAKAAGGQGAARLTLSAAVAPSWNEANVGFFVLRSAGRQRGVETAGARGRELELVLPAAGCSLLVADLGRPEDRGHPDSWRRSRRSLKAVLCQDGGDHKADLAARRRAAPTLLAKAGTRDEVRPLANPATTRPGSDLPVRLYADGRPAAGAVVVAEGPAGAASEVVADELGFAVVPLPVAGAWRVYFRPEADRVAELLFDVPARPAGGGSP